MENFGLYVIITKPTLNYREIAEICVAKEVKMLQLREKHFNDKELLKVAREIASITKGTATNFIVNDRVDIALLSDADGVHLGQDDLSITEARKILGNDKIIGLSTHSIKQAQEALIEKPDYIGFGPIYATPTKEIADPVVGTNLLNEVMQFADVPVVAIGGIDENNIKVVIGAGAKNVCAVRFLMNTSELASRIDFLNDLISK
ncbi:MAG: thiamine phosphate synthase [Rikenellaceae bacterium]